MSLPSDPNEDTLELHSKHPLYARILGKHVHGTSPLSHIS